MDLKFEVSTKCTLLAVRRISSLLRKLLLNLLRDELDLTGAKYGCGIGECGACTVHVDGEPVLGCMTLAVDCDGKSVETIENLSDGQELHPIQQAYLDEGAVQCGFCTPGFIMATRAFLKENPDPTDAEMRRATA